MLDKKSVVTVIGGSGFLGTYVVRHLAPLSVRIQVLSRHATIKAGQLRMAGEVGQVVLLDIDALDNHQLEEAISKSSHVVNLVGVLFSRGAQNFEALHHNLANRVATLCHKHGVKKLVHVSALGVDKAHTSKYARTKLAGEKVVLKHCSNATILRPSILFGPEDNFINMFNRLSKISPILPLIGGGHTMFQPVYVDDVAKAIVACLQDSSTNGKIFELGGPQQYSFRQILEYITDVTHRHRLLLPLPFGLIKMKAFFWELMGLRLLSVDQVELLHYNNVLSGANGLETLGITPTPMEVVVPTYIS